MRYSTKEMTFAKGTSFLFAVILLIICSSCGGGGVKGKVKDTMEIVYRMPVTTNDAPWKMMNGIYAVGMRYVILDAVSQERLQAASYIAGNGIPGLVREDEEGGFFSAKAGDMEGERHRDEFVSIFAEAGADASLSLLSGKGQMVGINTFIRRSMRMLDVERLRKNKEPVAGPDGNELGWTLMLMAYSHMLKSSWMNVKGNIISSEDIMQVALERPISWGSYNGLMENYGIAVALREYKKNLLKEEFAKFKAASKRNEDINIVKPTIDSLELQGVWGQAQERVNRVIDTLEQNRNKQGIFTAEWYKGPKTGEPAEEVLYTGLAMDFLTVALPDDELEAGWVRKAFDELAYIIRNNRYQLYEYNDALTKAAHALRAYYDRTTGNEPIRDRDVLIEKENDQSPCCG